MSAKPTEKKKRINWRTELLSGLGLSGESCEPTENSPNLDWDLLIKYSIEQGDYQTFILTDPRGSLWHAYPKGPNILVWRTNFMKRSCVGSCRPPTRLVPPTGNPGSATVGSNMEREETFYFRMEVQLNVEAICMYVKSRQRTKLLLCLPTVQTNIVQ